MKNIKIITIFFLLCSLSGALFGLGTPSSFSFAHSYLQRATGVEALYWNPANITNIPTKAEIMLPLSLAGSAENNMMSLDLYNRVMGATLDDPLKQEMLNALDGNLRFGVNVNMITGFALGNFAYSTGVTVVGKGMVDEQFIELALTGNETTEGENHSDIEFGDYDFSDEHNEFLTLAYQDVSIGYGGFRLNQLFPNGDNIPNIYAGIGISSLIGYFIAEVTEFSGSLEANNDGLTLDQTTKLKTGTLGTGFKMSLGFSVDAVQFDENHYITAGLSMDNIFGQIRWRNNLEETRYEIFVDDYILNDLNFGMHHQEEETLDAEAFTSRIPFLMKMGGFYRYNDFSASLDYAQYIGSSKAFNYDPNIALGLEYLAFNYVPVQFGLRLPIGDLSTICSLGIGYRHKNVEVGLAYQSFDAFLGENTKGLAYSMYSKIRF
ncbi:MAG: hypothetical protein FWG98_08855 [Candidatus Cloacimonetes bacterium]|nr:hypothetical protein [Candidatus Cloacimonadota bacterium]